MSIAATIDEAYRAVNPDQPLEAGNADPRYVDCSTARGGEDVVSQISRRITRSQPPLCSKQLFTGHRGCGKTTELFRLKHRLEQEGYFVVYFDAEADLDIGDLDYPDVLLTIAQQIEAQLRQADLWIRAELLESVGEWFDSVIKTEERSRRVERQVGTEFTLAPEVPFLAKMLASVKGGHQE